MCWGGFFVCVYPQCAGVSFVCVWVGGCPQCAGVGLCVGGGVHDVLGWVGGGVPHNVVICFDK